MAEERATVREMQLRDFLPWLGLFRAFGIAIDPRKLLLAGVGVLVMNVGWFVLAALFSASSDSTVQEQTDSVFVQFGMLLPGLQPDSEAPSQSAASGPRAATRWNTFSVSGATLPEQLRDNPAGTLRQLGTNWRFVLRPYEDLFQPFREVFASGRKFVPVVFTFVCGVWAVLVWSYFGGAITRIAAIQFARDEKISLREALKFARARFLSYAGAPVMPLVFIAVMAFFCLAGGALNVIGLGIGRNIGPIFAGLLWFLPLIAGFIMAIIALGWAVGWPLMYSTISVEGSDTFDALSRSYAYVFQRPWHYLFYAFVVLVFGSFCSFFVLLMGDLLVQLSMWAVALLPTWWPPSWWGEDDALKLVQKLTYYAPEASGWQAPGIAGTAPTGAAWFGAVCAGVWLYILFLLLVGFVYSYFWSAATAVYYLLRRDVDNTELEEVYLEGSEDDFEPPGQAGSAISSGAASVQAQGSVAGASPETASPNK
ncbi:MAG: hypothetical protein HY000_37745 [Planctomycetes bacterium]|nr:hypothetical protein [Planctomycetota bacterium]